MPRMRRLSPEAIKSIELLTQPYVSNPQADAYARKIAFELAELDDESASDKLDEIASKLAEQLTPDIVVRAGLTLGFEHRVAQWRSILMSAQTGRA